MKYTSWPRFLLLFFVAAIDPVVNQAQFALFPISENGQWGLMDESGKTVVPTIYSAAVQRGQNLVEIRMPGGRGLIDREGKELLPARYAEIYVVRDSVVWFRDGAAWGYLHLPSGNQLPPIYARPDWHRGNYLYLETKSADSSARKTLHTLVSFDAQIVIPPMEASILPFRGRDELMQLVAPDKKVGFWDLATGRFLEPKYREIEPLKGTRFAAIEKKGDRLQLIDIEGNRLADREFDELKDREKGWIQFRDSLVHGLINAENELLIQAAWEDMRIIGEETVAFQQNGRWGLIKVDSTVIFPAQFSKLKSVRDETILTTLDTGLEGKLEAVYRTNGDTLIPPSDHNIFPMSGGPGYVVETAGGQTWHDEHGLPSPVSGYTTISDFVEGLAEIAMDSLKGMMDTRGQIVVPVEFTKIVFKDGLLRAYRGDEERVFAFDEEGRLLTGNRFILVRGDESYGGSTSGNWQQIRDAGWFFYPRLGKYGLKDPETDSIIIPPRYDRVTLIGNTGLTKVERRLETRTLYGVVDHSRFRKVIDPILPEVHDEDYLQANLARVTLSNGRRTLLSRRGKVIHSIRLRYVGKYSEGKSRIMLDGKLRWESGDSPQSLEVRTKSERGGRANEFLHAYEGKWGFIDRDGEWLCEAEYDYVTDFKNGIALVMKKDKNDRGRAKWGAIDSSFQVIIPVEYDYLSRLDNSATSPLIAGRAHGGTGFVSAKGEVITGPGNNGLGFEDGKEFSEGLAAVKLAGKWGFVNLQGQLAIAADWDMVGDFHEGLAWVRKGREIRIIDQVGNVTETEKGVYRMGDFHDGLAPANAFGKYGYLDRMGRWAVQPQFLEAGEFCHGLAAVRTKSGRGMIDRSGNMVVKARYQRIMPFENGMAAIYENGKYGLIDSLGQVVVAPRYLKVGPFREGLAMVKAKNWRGFIDREGEVVIKGKFRDLKDFSNGLAAAMVGDRWGYLDRQGQMVIAPQFIVARDFENGRSLARERSHWHLIDTTGADVVEPMEDIYRAEGFRNGMAVAQAVNGSWMYLDSLGNELRQVNRRKIMGAIPFTDGVGQVQVDGGWQLVDRSMQPLLSINFLSPATFSEGMGKVQFGMKYGMYAPDGEVLLEVKYDRLENMGPVIQVGEGAALAYIRPDGSWLRR